MYPAVHAFGAQGQVENRCLEAMLAVQKHPKRGTRTPDGWWTSTWTIKTEGITVTHAWLPSTGRGGRVAVHSQTPPTGTSSEKFNW